MTAEEEVREAFGVAEKERRLFARLASALPSGHPYRALLQRDNYPEEALRGLLLRQVSKRVFRQDLREEICRETGYTPSADIQVLPSELFRLWAGRDALALYRPDTIWAESEDEHLLLHEMMHSVQNQTSGSLPRGINKNILLLGEALVEEWVSVKREERGLYSGEREKLRRLASPQDIKKWAPFQGERLLSLLPEGFWGKWIAK